ncbi:glycoside hydrolase family 65 protein [Ruania alkalisoli]|uniref:Glycoside hydrolase family 65 protein n=1 Tax=Ruania alkalisoli TaxID=2779775 RepID=A0A7M1SSJ5_9MICO|nr:glycoside hydrolase family 65 protein [Ruania alkalisoli]QOR70465.1 glycoside hydrolase family 65 protein [Ruania alkalisoli]
MFTTTLTYDSYEPATEGLREALTSTGNGYICTRGAAEWEDPGASHYPGTYTHSGFNRETTIVAGRAVLNEDLVNLPNWLVLKLRVEDGEPFRLAGTADVLEYRHEYDLATATVSRFVRFRDPAGRETSLTSRRFVSMSDRHWAGIEWTITPENWSGRLEVITALDGRVTNWGVARYQELEGRHLDPVVPRTFGPEVIGLKVRTRQSQIHVGQAARTRVLDLDGQPVNVARELYQMEDYIHQTISFSATEGEPIRVEKMVALYNSRDHAMSEPLTTAGTVASRLPTFAEAFTRHQRAWSELWERCGVEVGDDEVQLRLNLHIAHILQVCSRHTAELDAGAPARGLNGEAYRGHIFWDELFIYPFLNYRLPEVTRSLLMYRCRRLDEARAAAADAGYRGAMYPWQSGSDGTEETQVVHLNPRNGQWEPDLSHNQRHVNAAICYNIWQYYQATGDIDFLSRFGAEVLLEITRFWASLATFNADRGRWEINGVMGPDEFHEKYPGSDEEGLRNNAYTNVMVAWLAHTAGQVLAALPVRRRRRLWDSIGLTEGELEHWAELARLMYIPFHEDENGDAVISQFEGYEDLEELDWAAYRSKYGNIQRLDRILRAEGDTPDRYKLAKQADTLMLFYVFSDTQLAEILGRLGYGYEPDAARRNIGYYESRTTHGSTLSYIVHAHVLARFDPDRSWEMFRTALDSDLNDVQGGTTAEGIHLGVMAGTLDLIQRGYLGTEGNGELLRFTPRGVQKLAGQSMTMRFRETVLKIAIDHERLSVSRVDDSPTLIWIAVEDSIQEARPAQAVEFTLQS